MKHVRISWSEGEPNFDVVLRPEELLLLDGKVGTEVQQVIDLAREAERIRDAHGITFSEALFVARTVAVALQKGRLECRPVSMRRCSATGKQEEMVVPEKATRKNPDRSPFPRPLRGYELDVRAVIVENAPALGISKEAFERLQPVLAAELEDVEAEIPEGITGHKPRFKRYNIIRCDKCEYMDSEDTFKGQTYQSRRCPKCGNNNTFRFSPVLSEFIVKPVRETAK